MLQHVVHLFGLTIANLTAHLESLNASIALGSREIFDQALG
jgi:hypothetical protein